MKEKNNGGFSLVEVLLAMMILAAIVIPVCSGILLSVRMDTRANDVLQARVAVSSAVETLMAEGIPASKLGTGTSVEAKNDAGIKLYDYMTYTYEDARFSTLTITVSQVKKNMGTGYVLMPWYDVNVVSEIGAVEAKTSVRAVTEAKNGGSGA